MSEFVTVGKSDEIGESDASAFQVGEHLIAVARVDGELLVFSGDLVFAGSIGRSDFANSDPAAMRRSLVRFLTLPDDLRVLPGHGPETTVGRERATNPYLREFG